MFLLHHLDLTIKKLREQMANILTIINLSFGVSAILFIFQDELQLSLLFIFLAALFDRFDGMVARRLNSTSDFGKQLDSLCDIISFGVAPALLIYNAKLFSFGLLGMLAPMFFVVCSAIRLARFNIAENNNYFVGLPITAAGCLQALQLFFLSFVPGYVCLALTVCLSILMISTFTLKKI